MNPSVNAGSSDLSSCSVKCLIHHEDIRFVIDPFRVTNDPIYSSFSVDRLVSHH